MRYKDMNGVEIFPGDSVWILLDPTFRMMFTVTRFSAQEVILGHIGAYECAQAQGRFKGFNKEVIHFHQLQLI